MICSRCGNQSPDGVLFCTFCGNPFNQNQLIPVDKQNMQPVPTQNQMYQPGPFNSTDQAAMEYEDTPIDEPIVRLSQEQAGGRRPNRFLKWFLRKKVLIPSIVGLVLVIGLVITYFVVFTPKKRVMAAFAATYNEDYFSDSFVLERELGLYDLLNNLFEQGGVIRETAKGAFDEDDESFKQSFSLDKNNKLKLMSAELSVSLEDESFGGTFIGTPDETYFKSDEMDGYFAIKNSRVYKQLQKSPVLEEQGIEYDYDADFDIDWFGDQLFVYEDGRTSSLSKESEERLEKELYDYMEVRTAGTQDVKIGGKDKKAKKYHIIIYKSDLKEYIETFEEIYMDEIFEINYASYSKEYRDLYEDSMEQSFEKVIDGVDEDFEMDVFVYHGKVAGFTAECSFDIDDDEQEISLECSNEGAQNLLTDVSFKYSLSEKNEDVSFVIEKKTDESDDGVEETIKCTISEEYEDYEGFTSTLIITTEVEGDDFSFEVGDENKWGDETLIYVSGDINNIKKGTLLDLTIDNVEIEDEPYYDFNADVYINANPSEADPKDYKFSDKKCYILEEDQEDIEAFYENED